MDLVREIFKQKIAAFLLFFEVFPEYIPKPLSTKVENNSTQVQSPPVILNREKEVGVERGLLVRAPNVKGRGEGLD